jgi:hypothetical protein
MIVNYCLKTVAIPLCEIMISVTCDLIKCLLSVGGLAPRRHANNTDHR